VRPPDAEGWQHTARAWLLDLCPPDYRAHPVITRHPVVLARLAVHHVAAQLQAQRAAVATLRDDLAAPVAQGVLEPGVVERALEALDVEQARLLAAHRGARVVEQALRGQRRAPRL
jgi:hypothetical protein